MDADKSKGMQPRMTQMNSDKSKRSFSFALFGFGVYRRSSAVTMVFDFAFKDGI